MAAYTHSHTHWHMAAWNIGSGFDGGSSSERHDFHILHVPIASVPKPSLAHLTTEYPFHCIAFHCGTLSHQGITIDHVTIHIFLAKKIGSDRISPSGSGASAAHTHTQFCSGSDRDRIFLFCGQLEWGERGERGSWIEAKRIGSVQWTFGEAQTIVRSGGHSAIVEHSERFGDSWSSVWLPVALRGVLAPLFLFPLKGSAQRHFPQMPLLLILSPTAILPHKTTAAASHLIITQKTNGHKGDLISFHHYHQCFVV